MSSLTLLKTLLEVEIMTYHTVWVPYITQTKKGKLSWEWENGVRISETRVSISVSMKLERCAVSDSNLVTGFGIMQGNMF